MEHSKTGDALIEERNRIETNQPGLRASYVKFLKDYRKYVTSIEGGRTAKKKSPHTTHRFLT